MRVVCFVNRQLGSRIAVDLMLRPDVQLVAIVTNDPPHVDLDARVLGVNLPVLRWSDYLTAFRSIPSDLGVSALFRHRVPMEILARMPIVNLHPSLLPWGRGSHPATWAIWESTPFGGTAHMMAEAIDSGPILAQRVVAVESADTSASLYAKGLDTLWDLYRAEVGMWLTGAQMPLREQPPGGSQHSTEDLKQLFRLDQAGLTTEDRDRLVRALDTGIAVPRIGARDH